MEKDGAPRVETVVIYVPDVHSCLPSVEEYQTLNSLYQASGEETIARRNAAAKARASVKTASNEENQQKEKQDNVNNANEAGDSEATNNNDSSAVIEDYTDLTADDDENDNNIDQEQTVGDDQQEGCDNDEQMENYQDEEQACVEGDADTGFDDSGANNNESAGNGNEDAAIEENVKLKLRYKMVTVVVRLYLNRLRNYAFFLYFEMFSILFSINIF